MNGNDRPPEWPVRPDHDVDTRRAPQPNEGARRRRRGPGLNWTTLALIAGLLLLVVLVAYFATTRNPDQDKLTGSEAGNEQASAADPQKLCGTKATYDLIKRELFRRAAQVRGSDQAAFDRLSAYSVVRMENPVMESQDSTTKAANCSGSLSLDLPPGVAVVGGRRTLTSDVDYTVQPAADGSGNVVLLRNADAIIAPLATLARVADTGSEAPALAPASPEQQAAPTSAPPSSEAAPPAEQPEASASSGTHPSFDCANARTKGEIAVCSDSGLAALDRNMAAQYGRAMGGASPDQAALLRRTRDRFLSYRDHCPNRSCMGDAYVGRVREIRDIMEGRWQPER